MTGERLTKKELGWLLALEAKGAAEQLRADVTQLAQALPPIQVNDAAGRVTTTLDALDDAIGLLTAVDDAKSSSRGRVDVASLLFQLIPRGRISVEPGEGTEVFGVERELGRLLHVLLSQSASPGTPVAESNVEVRVRREGDFVRVQVELGPDRSATIELERRWLERMALRLGGRLELDGAKQSLLLPADASSSRKELEALQVELEQAKLLGETYARELAEAFTMQTEEEPPPPTRESTFPRTQDHERLGELLLSWLGKQTETLSRLAEAQLPPELATMAHRCYGSARQLEEQLTVYFTPLAKGGSTPTVESLLQQVLATPEVARHRDFITLGTVSTQKWRRDQTRLIGCLSELLQWSLRSASVERPLKLWTSVEDSLLHIFVEDGGPIIPDNLWPQLLRHELDGSAVGRPGGMTLPLVHWAAQSLGGELRLERSAPVTICLEVPFSKH